MSSTNLYQTNPHITLVQGAMMGQGNQQKVQQVLTPTANQPRKMLVLITKPKQSLNSVQPTAIITQNLTTSKVCTQKQIIGIPATPSMTTTSPRTKKSRTTHLNKSEKISKNISDNGPIRDNPRNTVSRIACTSTTIEEVPDTTQDKKSKRNPGLNIRVEMTQRVLEWVQQSRSNGKLPYFTEFSDRSLVAEILGLSYTTVCRYVCPDYSKKNKERYLKKLEKKGKANLPKNVRKVTPEVSKFLSTYYSDALKNGLQPTTNDVYRQLKLTFPDTDFGSRHNIGRWINKLGFRKVVSKVRRIPAKKSKNIANKPCAPEDTS